MNFQIDQTPDNPGFYGDNLSESEQHLESNYSESESATALKFPASINQVATALSDSLGFTCNASTLKSRWIPDRILPVTEGLNVPEIKSDSGKITEFGYALIFEVVRDCIRGQNGFKIAPETVRERYIEQYGMKPVKDGLKTAKDLLEKVNQQNAEKQAEKQSTALAVVDAESELEILLEAARRLASDDSDDDQEVYELTAAEKAKLARKFTAKKTAEQEFLQKLARGEV
jgi:hypothetical protein